MRGKITCHVCVPTDSLTLIRAGHKTHTVNTAQRSLRLNRLYERERSLGHRDGALLRGVAADEASRVAEDAALDARDAAEVRVAHLG